MDYPDNPYIRSVEEVWSADPGARRFRVRTRAAGVGATAVTLAPGLPLLGSRLTGGHGPSPLAHKITATPSPYRECEWGVVVEYKQGLPSC